MSPSRRQAVNFLKCAFILVQSKLSIPTVVTNMSLAWPDFESSSEHKLAQIDLRYIGMAVASVRAGRVLARPLFR